jgi:hypothetical protein
MRGGRTQECRRSLWVPPVLPRPCRGFVSYLAHMAVRTAAMGGVELRARKSPTNRPAKRGGHPQGGHDVPNTALVKPKIGLHRINNCDNLYIIQLLMSLLCETCRGHDAKY